jgi:hypothetical protein
VTKLRSGLLFPSDTVPLPIATCWGVGMTPILVTFFCAMDEKPSIITAMIIIFFINWVNYYFVTLNLQKYTFIFNF